MYTGNVMSREKKDGFTLLELLIVIAIIAILSVALILVINPAETLKKSRDAQRISDLSTMKTALGLYLTATSSPDLDASISNHCLGTGNTAALISYSYNSADVSCAINIAEGNDVTSGSTFGGGATDFCRYASASPVVDGTGWVPVNIATLTGGSPISNFPLDPVNTVTTVTTPTSADLVYRYACQNVGAGNKPSYSFELNAILESDEYKVGGNDDKSTKDGGDNTNYYEVGSSLKLIGTGTNF